MLERAQAGRHRQAAVVAAVLLLVKEDMGFVVLVLGLLWFHEGRRRLGAVVAAGGIGSVVVLNYVVMPLLGGLDDRNWQYTELGATPGQALGYVARHPLRFLTDFFQPVDPKVNTLIWLLLPVLFLALRSKLALLAVPLITERFWADVPNYWGRYWQYNAFVAVLLFCAAIDGARRLPRPQVTGLAWAMAALGAGLFVLPQEPLSLLTQSDFRQTSTPQSVAAHRALALVPPHQIVAVSRVVEALLAGGTPSSTSSSTAAGGRTGRPRDRSGSSRSRTTSRWTRCPAGSASSRTKTGSRSTNAPEASAVTGLVHRANGPATAPRATAPSAGRRTAATAAVPTPPPTREHGPGPPDPVEQDQGQRRGLEVQPDVGVARGLLDGHRPVGEDQRPGSV